MRIAVLALLLFAACTTPTIEQDRVTRVITTLAADDMNGRSAFSPDAMRAAEFIAAEFATIGLETPTGQEGYLQWFAVYSIAADSASVVLNGVPVAAEKIAVSVGAAGIVWTEAGGPAPVYVGKDDNLMQTWRGAHGGDDFLVVDPSQAETLERVKGFLARGSRTTSLEGG